ncbi:DUF6185 family protein [Streptomyces sp. NPDC102274]|uniref:DUF6185 family protein n=1 Tax=Streptomyces sp. NPDC102274 TaxID=3366151 RepID=UPI00382C7E1B
MNRWARYAVLVLLAFTWWGSWSARATAVAGDRCHAEQLEHARTDALVRFTYHGRTYVLMQGTMTVRVPMAWVHANDLLLGEDSARYQRAMRCLLREQEKRQYYRPDEWRVHSPQVTKDSRVNVRYETLSWISHRGHFEVGPWLMDVGAAHWKLVLKEPTALKNAHWERIEVDLAGLAAHQVSPTPSTVGKGKLVWRGTAGKPRPAVTVLLAPPWQRAWAASGAVEPWHIVSHAGLASSWVGASVLIALAALRARGQPAGTTPAATEQSAGRSLLQWGLLSAAIGVAVLLFTGTPNVITAVMGRPGWWDYDKRWQVLIGALAGWALVVLARPRRSMLVAASLAAAGCVLVASAPSLFGLPPALLLAKRPPDYGIITLAAVATAVLWLWLTGIAAWLWHLARKGGMLRAFPAPMRLRGTGVVLALVTLLTLGWYVRAGQRTWERATWLSDRTAPEYEALYVLDIGEGLVSFPIQIPTWGYTHTWVLTGIAIAALLRARALARPVPCSGPNGFERLLTAVLFSVVVVGRQISTSYAGNNALAGLWLALGVAALYALLAVGQRLAVLMQRLEGGAFAPAVGEAISEASHNELTGRARRYRELHTQLRRLEQGQDGGGTPTRHAMERELSNLHRWRPPGGPADAARPWLPSQVTVVDVALSWGPHANWWDNARRAALLAHTIGIPFSLFLVWLAARQEYWWMKLLHDSMGVPDLVWTFIGLQLTWAGAGLVLGALWRLLPGRRGPARALSLGATYGLLIGLGTLANHATDQELGNAAMSICLMLLVLTLTSLAMDADTFRRERRFWSSRIGLLVSIYQMRGFSVQIAYLTAQAVGVLTIWKFLVNIDPRSK